MICDVFFPETANNMQRNTVQIIVYKFVHLTQFSQMLKLFNQMINKLFKKCVRYS